MQVDKTERVRVLERLGQGNYGQILIKELTGEDYMHNID
jgi:hypothetical protein